MDKDITLEQEFDLVFKAHYSLVKNFALMLLKSGQDADDIAQDRKQPYGLAYIHHCGNRLLPDNRTDRKFLGLPGVHNHRL